MSEGSLDVNRVAHLQGTEIAMIGCVDRVC